MTYKLNRTFIAIDYGRKRIGLAKSDPTGTIASALTTFEINKMSDAVVELAVLIDEYKPDGLVVGYPLHISGEISDFCEEVNRFVKELKKRYSGPIELVDEYGTSKEARSIIHAHGKRVGRDKKRVDRLAAVMILQRYLDEKFI